MIEAEKELLSRSSEPARLKRPESVKAVSATLSEVKFLADQEFCEDLKKLRGLFTDLSLSELMKKMVKLTLEKFHPAQQKPKSLRKMPTSAMKKKTRYIPASTKREVWKRDEGRCTHCDPITGQRCNSQHRLEVDHIHPFAMGGDNSAENLRLLCAHHNKWQAGQIFGQEKMNQYAKK